MKVFESSNGFTIKIGENANENERLYQSSSQNDLWFHLQNVSSAHGILVISNKSKVKLSTIKQDILEAAMLIKHFSKQKNNHISKVIYCYNKNIKKTPNGQTGQVSLGKKPSVLSVRQNDELMEEILKTRK
ncbi:protein of unknown function duf814 [Anaeramoeba flamelloides]|uniref:NFACT RNA-binding domain-containing protein n=1 Tax=Anaeramoeba flamelloides TaxID=1746091 RepID=A0AAV7YAE6_9EUKA|nr:protein of unknown function duf814 [Anaeramoeba flamelloides]